MAEQDTVEPVDLAALLDIKIEAYGTVTNPTEED